MNFRTVSVLASLLVCACGQSDGDVEPVGGSIGTTSDAQLGTSFYGVRRRLDGRVEATATLLLLPAGAACEDGRFSKTPSGVNVLQFPLSEGAPSVVGLAWDAADGQLPPGSPRKVISGRVSIVERPSFTVDAVSGELVGDVSIDIRQAGQRAGSLAGRFRATHCSAMDDHEIAPAPPPGGGG
jgi:hypothetical protein